MMRVFLDTIYLMPLFRLENSVNLKIEEIKKLLTRDDLRFLYQMVSLIELKWIIIRGGENNDDLRDDLEDAFSNSLRYLEDNTKILTLSIDSDTINDVSYELEKYGHRDYFDTLILASAILHADILLTEDDAFIKLVDKQRQMKSVFYNPNLRILKWKEFMKTI
ncbi:MAG: PIN domain-containing protein [Candidatus Heimdallarchaeota archaeon]